MTARNADTIEIDRFVGKQIGDLRIAKGLTLNELAKLLKISQQQLSKYEKGINRISIGRLVCIAKVLGQNVSYFCDNAGEDTKIDKITYKPMYVEVSRSFMQIKNREYQRCIAALVKALAQGEADKAI